MLTICGMAFVRGCLSTGLALGGSVDAGKVQELETQRKLLGCR